MTEKTSQRLRPEESERRVDDREFLPVLLLSPFVLFVAKLPPKQSYQLPAAAEEPFRGQQAGEQDERFAALPDRERGPVFQWNRRTGRDQVGERVDFAQRHQPPARPFRRKLHVVPIDRSLLQFALDRLHAEFR
jgi:hypothetical protein